MINDGVIRRTRNTRRIKRTRDTHKSDNVITYLKQYIFPKIEEESLKGGDPAIYIYGNCDDEVPYQAVIAKNLEEAFLRADYHRLLIHRVEDEEEDASEITIEDLTSNENNLMNKLLDLLMDFSYYIEKVELSHKDKEVLYGKKNC